MRSANYSVNTNDFPMTPRLSLGKSKISLRIRGQLNWFLELFQAKTLAFISCHHHWWQYFLFLELQWHLLRKTLNEKFFECNNDSKQWRHTPHTHKTNRYRSLNKWFESQKFFALFYQSSLQAIQIFWFHLVPITHYYWYNIPVLTLLLPKKSNQVFLKVLSGTWASVFFLVTSYIDVDVPCTSPH